LAVYDLQAGEDEDRLAEVLADCWCLVKDGVVIREEGAFTGVRKPSRAAGPTTGETGAGDLRGLELFENATLRVENLGLPGIGE
jgi:hypothetical protein